MSVTSRRAFLRTAVAAVVAAASGEWIGRAFAAKHATPGALAIPETAALAPGESLPFEVAHAKVEGLAVRLADGTLRAYDRRCPHLGCPVLWSAARERFECPCHAAAFDGRTGAVLSGPPRRGLTALEIRDPDHAIAVETV